VRISSFEFLAFLVLVVAFTVASANAAPIRFDFEGYVTKGESSSTHANSDGEPRLLLPGTPAYGSTISGYYIVDPTATDRAAETNRGNYLNAVIEFQVDFGGLNYTVDFYQGGFTDIRVEDNISGRDQYLVWIRESNLPGTGIVGPSVSGYDPIDFQLSLFDWESTTPDLINGDALPLHAPDLSLVDNPFYPTDPYLGRYGLLFMGYELAGEPRQARIYGEITSLNSTVLPLPAAAWLFLSGLGVLRFAGWRRVNAQST